MPLAVDLLVQIEGLLAELTCLGQIPLVPADLRQVVEGGGDAGMPLAVDLLVQVEGLLE